MSNDFNADWVGSFFGFKAVREVKSGEITMARVSGDLCEIVGVETLCLTTFGEHVCNKTECHGFY